MSPYETIETEKANHSVERLCEAFGLSRSGYYAWRRSTPSERELRNAELLTRIRSIHREHKGRYGGPRIHKELTESGEQVSRGRVERLMRKHGIQSRPRLRYRRATDSAGTAPPVPNVLDRNFTMHAPNQAWAGDITYIWTTEGWSYLAVLIDLYSRKVVGWALDKSLSRELPLAALRMALITRRPPAGLVHHTDRGCQYSSGDYRAALEERGLVCSMSRAGNCWDNAVSESFFATLKKELVHGLLFVTRTEAYDSISDYIDNYYNARRRHSANDYQSPNTKELQAAMLAA